MTTHRLSSRIRGRLKEKGKLWKLALTQRSFADKMPGWVDDDLIDCICAYMFESDDGGPDEGDGPSFYDD